MSLLTTFRSAALAAAMILAALSAAHADEQYFPLQSYRVGPYAAGGTGYFGGFIDYMNLINIRDGGVNGVKLAWDECETRSSKQGGPKKISTPKSRIIASVASASLTLWMESRT